MLASRTTANDDHNPTNSTAAPSTHDSQEANSLNHLRTIHWLQVIGLVCMAKPNLCPMELGLAMGDRMCSQEKSVASAWEG